MKKLNPEVKKMSPEQKKKLLETEVKLLNKRFKKEVINFGYTKKIERIPFKSPKLNEITGGGVPTGRFSIIWGAKGSAKTSMAYSLIATAQEMGRICYYIDQERSFDPTWADIMGVDVNALLMGDSFETAEEAMDSVIALTKTKSIGLIIIDSIQGLSPKGEQETKKHVPKSLEDDTMALLARKLSQFFRMSAAGIAESDCTLLLIGQTRMDLGGFITLEKLSGGNALEHWSSLTVHLRRGKGANAPTKKIDGKDTKIGFDLVARVDKSKVGPDEGKVTHMEFLYGKGVT